jgi:aspartyl-tRNA(Asn)/glutamyl-tRNA(Gln) amidotransferase subunit A
VGETTRRQRIAVVRDIGPGFPSPDPTMAAAFDDAVGVLAHQGATLVPVQLPLSAEKCFQITRLIGPPESAAIHAEDFHTRGAEMGAALRDKLIGGARVTAVDYMQALWRMDEVAESMTALLREFDALVTFGTLHTPPRLGVEPEMTAFTVETALTPFNLSGHPALVQCTGFTDAGLPLHWQIVANRGSERELFRVAAAYEAATGWRDRRPRF